ncbi:hypothetical protein DRE_01241 [Drechslerella stenobrocha 248]|uniref:Uncharacterized protein n=1 Tax=Drechslerella stenobrocha 248 TaxID=1043628 RepID=W7HLE6_9PEZI|nr:hypothetical protein DRE_01241 [Drechslerella stenobrocha 248]
MDNMIRDPRVRQTLNQISDNFESVADTAKFGCFSFTKSYLEPCIDSIRSVCPSPETACPCFYHDPPNARRRRRGRPEFAFEFYNSDYDDDYAPEDPLRWGNDELDRLLAGSGIAGRRRKPGARNEGMYYTRSGQRRIVPDGRRKSALIRDGGPDPTIIPNTSALGFLSYFPWVRKRQALRYKPSAADLQDHPGGYGGVGGVFREAEAGEQVEPLLGSVRDGAVRDGRRDKRGRSRSATTSSGDTTDTLRSRADLFPSEDEADAVPLDDEFEINLDPETGSTSRRSKKGPRRQRTGDTTDSGPSTNGSIGSPVATGKRRAGDDFRIEDDVDFDDDAGEIIVDSPAILKGLPDEAIRREEEAARKEEEEHATGMRREAAKRLAMHREYSEEGPSSPLLDTADRAVPMFPSISPVLLPSPIVADTPTPLALPSKESEYPSDSAVDLTTAPQSGSKDTSLSPSP